MRTSLFALAFGALLLTGCADDLTGPDVAPLAGETSATRAVDTRGVDTEVPETPAPDTDDATVSALFAAWTGAAEDLSFQFTLEPTAAPDAPVIFEMPDEVYFAGEGSYERLNQLGVASPCRVEGQYVDGTIVLTISDERSVIATAEGTTTDDFDSLTMKMEHVDGTVEWVTFERSGGRFLATK